MKKLMVTCGLVILLLSGCSLKPKDTAIKEKDADSTSVIEKKKKKEKKDSSSESSVKKESKNEKKATKTNGKIFTPNPEDEDEEVMYESDGEGKMRAVIPDYSHYTKDQVIEMLGEPDRVVTDGEELQERLEEKEWERIKDEFSKGKLTESQAKAFMFSSADVGIATGLSMDMEALIYEDQDKPNVYLSNGKVMFITPMTDYIDFNGKIVTGE